MAEPPPAQREAQEKMRQWMEQHHPLIPIPGPFGGFGQLGLTVQNLVAAAGAGEFALAPDVGEAINKQLTEVQSRVDELRRGAVFAAADPQFGGGYAERVSRFVQGVAAGGTSSAEEVLGKFREELDQLKTAVARSIGSYQAADSGSARGIATAGGQG